MQLVENFRLSNGRVMDRKDQACREHRTCIVSYAHSRVSGSAPGRSTRFALHKSAPLVTIC